MPELPDIQVYLAALEQRILDRTLERIRFGNPFLLRSVAPPLTDPRLLSGIGNAYSDEILHRAKLSRLLKDDWPRRLADLEK